MLPLGEILQEVAVWSVTDGSQLETDGGVVNDRCSSIATSLLESELIVRVDLTNDDTLGGSLVEQLGVILDGTCLGESGRLDEGQSEVENSKGWNQCQTLHDSPSARELVDVTCIDWSAVGGDDDDGNDGTDKVTPTLVGEDDGDHGTSLLEVSSVGNDRGRHWVVSTNADSHDDSEDGKPDGDAVSTNAVRCGDDEDDCKDDDDKFLSVDGRTSQRVTEESEENLTNDVTNVGGCFEHTTVQSPVDILRARFVIGNQDHSVLL